jgi:hypothetical protein
MQGESAPFVIARSALRDAAIYKIIVIPAKAGIQ